MAKEKKVEYERVDKKSDKYRRILVKFNPHFMRAADIEIEFIPLEESIGIGKVFVMEIDSISTIDLWRWATRYHSLSKGDGGWERGYIPTKDENMALAEIHMDQSRSGKLKLEPRQIISRVKRVFEEVRKGFSEPTAFAYSNYLYSGELGSLPYADPYFTVEHLKSIIEETPYHGRNANGEIVERPLVDHLFDTHKTKYAEVDILNFLEAMRLLREEILGEEVDSRPLEEVPGEEVDSRPLVSL